MIADGLRWLRKKRTCWVTTDSGYLTMGVAMKFELLALIPCNQPVPVRVPARMESGLHPLSVWIVRIIWNGVIINMA